MNTNLQKIILSAIVAKATDSVIGNNCDMPWHMPSDLKYFKKMTMGKPVIMGRVTWESLPFPLKGRHNLILTRNKSYFAKGAEVFCEENAILRRAYELAEKDNVDEIMVIGGGQIYEIFLHLCERIYLTRIKAKVVGDTYFPIFTKGNHWELIKTETMKKRENDQFPSERKIYERIPTFLSMDVLTKASSIKANTQTNEKQRA